MEKGFGKLAIDAAKYEVETHTMIPTRIKCECGEWAKDGRTAEPITTIGALNAKVKK